MADIVEKVPSDYLGSRSLDILGINHYPDNQWFLSGGMIGLGHHCYRPFREILLEIGARYARPLAISETGADSTARPAWLDYVVGEVVAARSAGARIDELSLYPILVLGGLVLLGTTIAVRRQTRASI
jgi:hypothetical protein